MILLFYIFSTLTIASGASLMFLKNIIHAALMLIVALVSIAGIFILAGADFLAIAQIMIYVGGILVLLLFGIMLTKRNMPNEYPASKNRSITYGIGVAVSIGALLSLLIYKIDFDQLEVQQKAVMQTSTIKQLGLLMMTQNVVAFELAGIILMVALMGASMLAAQTRQTA